MVHVLCCDCEVHCTNGIIKETVKFYVLYNDYADLALFELLNNANIVPPDVSEFNKRVQNQTKNHL